MTKVFAQKVAANQRLIILRALSEVNDGRLNETLLMHKLDAFGHTASRAELRDQIRFLEGAGAVTVEFPGEAVMVATLTRRGQDHVDRRGDPIEGVDSPSRI
ncbi:MAG: hypothetical protein AAGD13_25400 [Pseudomonadota bacterium]